MFTLLIASALAGNPAVKGPTLSGVVEDACNPINE